MQLHRTAVPEPGLCCCPAGRCYALQTMSTPQENEVEPAAEPSTAGPASDSKPEGQQQQTRTAQHWLRAAARRVATGLWKAWKWFDVNVGWFVGLDEPKYKWAILEYERRIREDNEAIMNGDGVRIKAAQDDTMEGGPQGTEAPVPQIMLVERQPQQESLKDPQPT